MKHVLAWLPNMALKYLQSNVCILLLYTMWCNGKDLSWRHIMDLYEEDGKPRGGLTFCAVAWVQAHPPDICFQNEA